MSTRRGAVRCPASPQTVWRKRIANRGSLTKLLEQPVSVILVLGLRQVHRLKKLAGLCGGVASPSEIGDQRFLTLNAVEPFGDVPFGHG